jgi:CRISPR-associated endoribonuclease Cas6
MTTELISLVIQVARPAPAVLPRDLSRASHAIFLQAVARHSAALAQHLHQDSQIKPFTCSNVHGGHRQSDRLQVEANTPLWMRFTGLNAEVCAALRALAQQPPASVNLDGEEFGVSAATLDAQAHPRANSSTYETLGAPYLLAKDAPDSRVALRFVSPTAFRAKGQNLPLPLPRSVFGSLLDKWNAFGPIALSEDVQRFAEECLAISQFKGRTRAWGGKAGKVLIGFVGQATFAALNKDRYWLSLINLLADYAFYAGVGYQTTSGMGQVRRVSLLQK